MALFICRAAAPPPIPPPVTGRFKFNPGWYIGVNYDKAMTTQIAQIDTIGAKKQAGYPIVGINFYAPWVFLENPNVPGDFSGNWDATGYSGFKLMDKVIAKCQQYGFQLSFGVQSANYNKPRTSFPTNILPAYLASAAYGPTVTNTPPNYFFGGAWVSSDTTNAGGQTAQALIFNKVGGIYPVADRLSDLIDAYGARYNAVSTFEYFTPLGESATAAESGYTDAGMLTALNTSGLLTSGRSNWATTMLRYPFNYGQTNAGLNNLMVAAQASFWSTGGGPDCCNEAGETCPSGTGTPNPRTFTADQLYGGRRAGFPTPNRTGVYDWLSESQSPEFGNAIGTFTRPAHFGSGYLIDMLHHANLQGATHYILNWNDFVGPNDNRMATTPGGTHPDLYDFIAANSLANTTYPTGWT